MGSRRAWSSPMGGVVRRRRVGGSRHWPSPCARGPALGDHPGAQAFPFGGWTKTAHGSDSSPKIKHQEVGPDLGPGLTIPAVLVPRPSAGKEEEVPFPGGGTAGCPTPTASPGAVHWSLRTAEQIGGRAGQAAWLGLRPVHVAHRRWYLSPSHRSPGAISSAGHVSGHRSSGFSCGPA